MASSASHMLFLLGVACGMVILMFGFSTMHSSLYTLQTSVDDHDSSLHRAEQASLDLAAKVTALEQKLSALDTRFAQEVETAHAERKSHSQWVADSERKERQQADVIQGLTKRVEDAAHSNERLASGQEEMRQHAWDVAASLNQTDEHANEALRIVTDLSSQHEALKDQANAWREEEQAFEQNANQADKRIEEKISQLSHISSGAGLKVQAVAASKAAVDSTTGKAAAARLTADAPSPAVAPKPVSESSSSGPALRVASTPHSTDAPKHASTEPSLLHPALAAPPSADGETTHPVSSKPRGAVQGTTLLPAHAAHPGDSANLGMPLPPQRKGGSLDYRITWYRECGCTGMEIEAVTLLLGLVTRLGAARVRTNPCSDTCVWPASTRTVLDTIEFKEEGKPLTKLLWDDEGVKPSGPIVLVIHAAFTGVCGVPDVWDEGSLTPNLELRMQNRSSGLFRVSRSMLESDRVQHNDVQRCNSLFDAVWVPSDFNVHTFKDSGVDAHLLRVLPEALDPTVYNCNSGLPPIRPPADFGNTRLNAFFADGAIDTTFTFLSMFKWEDRKNWRALVDAFLGAFPHSLTLVDPETPRKAPLALAVRLLIKTQQVSWGSDPWQDIDTTLSTIDAMSEAKSGHSPARSFRNPAADADPGVPHMDGRLLIVKDSLPSAVIPELYRASDAFVLPTHGEGWGLPIMEAMASGLPTIATGWGGSTEFMTSSNSFLLDYDLQDAPADPPYKWAEPNATRLREVMLDVVRRSADTRQLAEAACREIPGGRFSPAAVARRADELATEGLPSKSSASLA